MRRSAEPGDGQAVLDLFPQERKTKPRPVRRRVSFQYYLVEGPIHMGTRQTEKIAVYARTEQDARGAFRVHKRLKREYESDIKVEPYKSSRLPDQFLVWTSVGDRRDVIWRQPKRPRAPRI